MKIEVSAPGKLVLIGEYAVLFGAPALVMAVNRRSQVTLSPSASDRWHLSAPGLVPRPVIIEVDSGCDFRWLGDDSAVAQFDLVDRLLRELVANGFINVGSASPVDVVLDTTEFFRDFGGQRCKLGLGSSAALSVAFVSALAAWSGTVHSIPLEPAWLQTLVDVHRGIQGGAGSGIDVAASAIGGVVNYRLRSDDSVAAAMSSTLPDDLVVACIWTGKSASTGDFLDRLRQQRQAQPHVVNRAIRRLCDVSEKGVDALSEQAVPRFLAAVDEFWAALDSLGRSIDMPILSSEHRRLHQIAEECGARYKPSGAGGGDFGLAFSDNGASAREMVRRASAAGFEVVDLGVDTDGVKTTRS